MSNTRDLVAIDRIRQLLTSQFTQLPPERVAGAVDDALAELTHSAVRDFLPVLVERRARERLGNLVI